MSLLDDVSIVVTPNGYKAGELYAVIPSDGAADMDVTRATAATRVDENGLVNYAEVIGGEEVTNGDFATDLSGWTGQAGRGSYAWDNGKAKITNDDTSGYPNLSQSVTTVSGKVYKVNATVEIGTATLTEVRAYSGGVLGSQQLNTDGTIDFTFTAIGTSFTLHLYLFEAGNTGNYCFFDNVSVKEVTRDNVPRIDYTGGGCPHILAEPQRTNIVFPSDVAVTQTRTVTAVAYALSFYGTGSIVLSGTHSATLTGTGVNDRVDLIFTPTAGSLVLTVSGTVTNFQLEEGSYATSYIPTSGSTVTRNQDIFTRDGIGSLINSTEGVLFVEMAALSDDGTDRRISLNDGTVGNAINIGLSRFTGNINGEVYSGGALQTSGFAATGVTQTNNNKFALSWGSGTMKFYVNGSPTISITGVTSPIGLNSLKLSSGDDTLNLFAKVKQLQVYDTALTDTQLAALTS